MISFNLISNQTNIHLEYKNNLARDRYVLTPISVKYDSLTKSLVIAQELGFNVIRWRIDSSTWTLVAGSALSDLNGTSRTLFNKLCQVAINSKNNTFVADCYNQRIQFFRADLTPGKTLAGVISAKGSNAYLFDQPTAIALDQRQDLYVADSNNFRIQMFQQIQ